MKYGNIPYEKLKAILESVYEGLMITDANGIVLMVSDNFQPLYIPEEEDIVGKNVFELEQKGVFTPSVSRIVIETGEKVSLTQITEQQKEVVVTAVPIFDGDGNLEYVASYSKDVTDLATLQKECRALEKSVELYKKQLQEMRVNFEFEPGVIAVSEEMKRIVSIIDRIAGFDTNIFLSGSSGTGKSFLARYIHQNSLRYTEPFVSIDCGALPEDLLEEEMFGCERGASASEGMKPGLIEMANKGTLFINNLSALPPRLQGRLLEVIEKHRLIRTGGNHEIPVDFRLISAADDNLDHQAANGQFLKELYNKLKIIYIHVPNLADRKDDVLPLADLFLTQYNQKTGQNKMFSYGVKEALREYSWPENIPELKALVERLALTSENRIIDLKCLPKQILADRLKTEGSPSETLASILNDVEDRIIRDAYAQFGTSVGVAKALGISQPTAARKIKKYIENEPE